MQSVKPLLILLMLINALTNVACAQNHTPADKSRLVILADMGHDPDEEQQITHMLMTSNMFELEGLIAVTGRFFRPDPPAKVKKLMPHLFHELIDEYEKVYPNLKRHASGWHAPKTLRALVYSGQTGNGIADIGAGKSTAGSNWIIQAATKKDPRPLHIIVNAGSNTLAQALFDYRATHSTAELNQLISKLRVFDNGGQDEAGAWICHEFPDIHWVRGHLQTRSYGGPSNDNLGPHTWKPFAYSPEGQHQWAKTHVQTNHGPLGERYPDRTVTGVTHFIEGGGTIPWMTFVVPGLTNPNKPSWGGWSGRYSSHKRFNVPSAYSLVQPDELIYQDYWAYTDAETITDEWTDPETGKSYNDAFTPIWRWRKAMWNDFQARMDWSVANYEDANHHPHAVLNGDKTNDILALRAHPGDTLLLSAEGSSDPDMDALRFRWWVYQEAGPKPYDNPIAIESADKVRASVRVPSDALGRELHLILEVWDTSEIVPLMDYRRAVISVEPRLEAKPSKHK